MVTSKDEYLNFFNVSDIELVYNTFLFVGETKSKYFIFRNNTESKGLIIQANISKKLPSIISLPSVFELEPITAIEENGFYGITTLNTICIPKNYTSIRNYAFRRCTSLKVVYLPGNRVIELGRNVFQDTSADLKIYVPVEMINKYKANYSWLEYKEKLIPVYSPLEGKYPDEGINNGAINTLVTEFRDSKDINIVYNSYLYRIISEN